MKYTILPPQEAPRGLTAYAPPEDLLAHELGFYASNHKPSTKAKVRKVPEVKVVVLAPVVPAPVLVTEVIPTPFSLPIALKNAYKRFEEIEIIVIRPINADFDGGALGLSTKLDWPPADLKPYGLPTRRLPIRSIGEAESRLYNPYYRNFS